MNPGGQDDGSGLGSRVYVGLDRRDASAGVDLGCPQSREAFEDLALSRAHIGQGLGRRLEIVPEEKNDLTFASIERNPHPSWPLDRADLG